MYCNVVIPKRLVVVRLLVVEVTGLPRFDRTGALTLA